MFHRKAMIGGLLGGALGAALWALVVLVTEYEYGWIAWAVGGMVGYGVASGNRGVNHSPQAAGVLAVVLTMLAIPVGKYMGIQLSIPSDAELVEILMENTRNDEYVVSWVADGVVEEVRLAGQEVVWPPGVDPAGAMTEAEYPADIWAEAEARWAAMPEEERDEFRVQVEAAVEENLTAQLPEIRAVIGDGAFLASFGPMDLIFFGLAMVTAFGVAAGSRKTEEEVESELNEAVKLAMIKVMLADGRADEEEVQVVRGVYARLAGSDLSEPDLKREMALAHSGKKDIHHLLGELAPYLSEEGKEMVVRAAYLVAVADGDLQFQERELLSGIATAVGLPEGHLQGILDGILEEASTAGSV